MTISINHVQLKAKYLQQCLRLMRQNSHCPLPIDNGQVYCFMFTDKLFKYCVCYQE